MSALKAKVAELPGELEVKGLELQAMHGLAKGMYNSYCQVGELRTDGANSNARNETLKKAQK